MAQLLLGPKARRGLHLAFMARGGNGSRKNELEREVYQIRIRSKFYIFLLNFIKRSGSTDS
jgi:hypothetical protein